MKNLFKEESFSLKLFTFIFLFMVSSGLSAQELDVTDYAGRPGVAEGSEMLPKGKLMWEVGADYYYIADEFADYNFWTLHNSFLRYGLTKTTEVYAGFNIMHGELEEDEWKTGLGTVYVGGKFRICEKNGLIPEAAFVTYLILPVGKKEFRVNEVAPMLHLAFTHTLSQRMDLGYDFGLEWDGDSEKPIAAANLWMAYQLASRFGLYAESVNHFRKHDKPTFDVGLGFTWKLNRRIVFDVFGQMSCDNLGDYFGVSAGFCWLI